MNAPLLSVAFAAGVFWVQQQASVGYSGLALSAALVAGVGLWWCCRRQRRFVRLVSVLMAAALGVAWADWRASARLNDALEPGCERCDVALIGVVRGLPEAVDGWNGPAVRFEVEVEASQAGKRVPHQIILTWPDRSLVSGARGDPPLVPGQRWAFTATLRPPRATANPGVFDAERWWFERGIRALGSVRSGRWLADEPVWQPQAALDRARAHVATHLRQALAGARYAGVIVALVVGDQRGIDAADWAVFNRTGVSHLLAISGLHVTMLAALAAWVASGLWKAMAQSGRHWTRVVSRQQWAAAVGWLTALSYAGLAGWGVPAQRTVWMLGVVAMAWMSHRTARPWHVLASALWVVVALDPWSVSSAGFWLSFGAVAALMAGASGAPTERSWRGFAWQAIRAQAVVSIALAPASMLFFQQVSLVGPLANAIAIPVVSFIVTPLALLAGALSAVNGGAWSAQAAHAVLATLAHALTWMDSGTWSSVRWPAPTGWMMASAVIGLIVWMLPRAWPGRAVAVLFWLPLLTAGSSAPAPGTARLWALDVGQGSAVLVETAQHRLLFDAGPRSGARADAGERVIVPFMRAQGWNTIDTLVLSHSDLDHMGGAASVLAEQRVSTVVSGEPAKVSALLARGVGACLAGQAWTWEGVRFEFLHPDTDQTLNGGPQRESSNSRSCVLRVTASDQSALLTADIGVTEEAALIKAGAALQADVMIVPHHGSGGSSSDDFIAAVAPRWAVIQVGEGNRFGHPRGDVVERYRTHGAAVLRTDELGAIRIALAPSGTSWSAWRREAPRYWRTAPQSGADGTNLDIP